MRLNVFQTLDTGLSLQPVNGLDLPGVGGGPVAQLLDGGECTCAACTVEVAGSSFGRMAGRLTGVAGHPAHLLEEVHEPVPV